MQERFRRVPRPKGDGDMQAPPRSQYVVMWAADRFKRYGR